MRCAALVKSGGVLKRHNSGVRKGKWSRGHQVPRHQGLSAHRRPGYALVGCAPAEPTSVSPGPVPVSQGPTACKSKSPAPQATRCHGQEDRTKCSEGSLGFCPNNGVHLNLGFRQERISIRHPRHALASYIKRRMLPAPKRFRAPDQAT